MQKFSGYISWTCNSLCHFNSPSIRMRWSGWRRLWIFGEYWEVSLRTCYSVSVVCNVHIDFMFLCVNSSCRNSGHPCWHSTSDVSYSFCTSNVLDAPRANGSIISGWSRVVGNRHMQSAISQEGYGPDPMMSSNALNFCSLFLFLL